MCARARRGREAWAVQDPCFTILAAGCRHASPRLRIHCRIVQLTRRGFLASSALLLVREDHVRIHIVGEHAGAALALDEMGRTASLIGRTTDRSKHADAMVIDLGQQSVEASGQRYYVGASPQARAAALA